VCGDKGCADGSLCVPLKTGNKCVPTKIIRIFLGAATDEQKAKIKALAEKEAEELIREIVKRFCDKPENADKCEKVKEEIDNLRVRIAGKDDGGANLDIDVGDKDAEGASAGFRFFAAGDSSTVVNGAVNDPSVNEEGYTVGSAKNDASSANASPLVALLVAAIAAGL